MLKKVSIFKLFLLLSLLLTSVGLKAQSDTRITGQLTATCANANTACTTAGSTVEVSSPSFGVASITMNGTYSGSTINFEWTDDGGVNWYQDMCTRSDANLQESSEALPTNQTRAWDCGIGGANKFRVRQSAISTGTVNVGITLTTASIEPAPTVAFAINGGNPCANPGATVSSTPVTTSGNAATQIVGLVAGQKIYICALTVVGQSGTNPTFSLVQGTGLNCATGQTVLVAAFATPANTLYNFTNPVAIGATGNALCYLDGGTTPVQSATMVTVQQ